MGFLDHLWDETLAGPTPDSGIAKIRQFKPLRLHSGGVGQDKLPSSINNNNNVVLLGNNSPSASSSSGSGNTPSSPSGGMATPGSPFSPTTPGGNIKKLTRRKSREPKTPTGYDWIVLSALDR